MDNGPFAHLSRYTPPKTGLVSHLPPSIIPYAELMRLDKPAGYYAFYFPHLVGIFFTAALSSPLPSLSKIVYLAIVTAFANLFLRGAACTWNDALDAPMDRQVARCRHRPVARGAVSVDHAIVFAVAQSIAWLWCVIIWLHEQCAAPAMLLAATMIVYPYCKRVTNFPQIVLGFSLALGQCIGVASLNPDWLFYDDPVSRRAMVCLYLSNVVNAMIYDTVYAHQDLEDDLKAGVMTMAIACRGRSKEVLSFLAVVEVILLSYIGTLLEFSMRYWCLAVGGTIVVLETMLTTVQLKDPQCCWKWFKWSIMLTGSALCAGLVSECVW